MATIDVPTEPLDACEQAMVEQALTRVEFDGIRYSLVGASGSAKNGKFYAVESSFEKKLAERFRFSPQAAITYFGILVSSCKSSDRGARLPVWSSMIINFGTNDCRGWISQSLFRKLQAKAPGRTSSSARRRNFLRNGRNNDQKSSKDLPLTEEEEAALVEQAKRRIRHARFCGRIAFTNFVWRSTRRRRRAHSRSWRMKLAEHLDADIILPRSSVKPKYQGKVLRTIRSLHGRSSGTHLPRTSDGRHSRCFPQSRIPIELHPGGTRTRRLD